MHAFRSLYLMFQSNIRVSFWIDHLIILKITVPIILKRNMGLLFLKLCYSWHIVLAPIQEKKQLSPKLAWSPWDCGIYPHPQLINMLSKYYCQLQYATLKAGSGLETRLGMSCMHT